jgi:hypothetical protein
MIRRPCCECSPPQDSGWAGKCRGARVLRRPARPERPARHPHLPGHHDLRRTGERSRRARHHDRASSAASTSSTRRRCTPCRRARRPSAPPRPSWAAGSPPPGMRKKVVLATKVAGPSRGMPWVREGEGSPARTSLRPAKPRCAACRPTSSTCTRSTGPSATCPASARSTTTRKRKRKTSIHEQLEAMKKLVRRARCAPSACRTRRPTACTSSCASPSSTTCRAWRRCRTRTRLVSRGLDNGLDETMHRLGVSLLAYSPLAFGLLTGKYDQSGLDGPTCAKARMSKFESHAQAALGPSRGAGGGAPLQRTGPRDTASRPRAWRWPGATPSGAWPAPSSA